MGPLRSLSAQRPRSFFSCWGMNLRAPADLDSFRQNPQCRIEGRDTSGNCCCCCDCVLTTCHRPSGAQSFFGHITKHGSLLKQTLKRQSGSQCHPTRRRPSPSLQRPVMTPPEQRHVLRLEQPFEIRAMPWVLPNRMQDHRGYWEFTGIHEPIVHRRDGGDSFNTPIQRPWQCIQWKANEAFWAICGFGLSDLSNLAGCSFALICIPKNNRLFYNVILKILSPRRPAKNHTPVRVDGLKAP